MRVSVIIPSLNAVTLPRALRAVAEQTAPPAEVIVVGRDDVAALGAFPDVRFVDTGRPVCAAAARNRGMAAAEGDLFLFLDADCIPDPDWLAAHRERQAAGEAVVGGSVALSGSNYWAQSDNVSMFHDFVPEHAPGARRLLPTLNLSVRRQVWEQVGDLDESFPGAAAEDADWTLRMGRAGFRLFFEPAARVAHAPARTTPADVARHWRRLGHNAVRVRLRYPSEMKTPSWAHHGWAWRLLAPAIAGKITLDVYRQPGLWRHWRSLPVVFASKILYCQGAAQALASGFAFSK
jgi:GT2 family glycosyltransferase